MSEIGAFLKTLRGKLTLREAAKRSGLSHSYINSLEQGKHPKTKVPINPTPETLKRLSDAYDYDYEELMRKAGYLKESNGESHERDQVIDQVLDEFTKLAEEDQEYFLGLLKRMPKK